MRLALLLVGAAIALVLAALVALGRRAPVVALSCVGAGAALAGFSTRLVDCATCSTGPLILAAFASTPFFVAGWIALGVGGRGVGGLPLAAISALMLLQIAWSAGLVQSATFDGRCPCALFTGSPPTSLRAVGFDRVVGPWFLAEALVTFVLAARARRHAGR